MSSVTATELRQNIYRLLDEIIDTGEPLEIVRNGHRLRIEIEGYAGPSKLERMIGHGNPDGFVGDPDDLVDLKLWEWDPDRALDP